MAALNDASGKEVAAVLISEGATVNATDDVRLMKIRVHVC